MRQRQSKTIHEDKYAGSLQTAELIGYLSTVVFTKSASHLLLLARGAGRSPVFFM